MFGVIIIVVVCKIGDINYKKDEFIFGVLFCARTQQQQLTHTHTARDLTQINKSIIVHRPTITTTRTRTRTSAIIQVNHANGWLGL